MHTFIYISTFNRGIAENIALYFSKTFQINNTANKNNSDINVNNAIENFFKNNTNSHPSFAV